MASASLNNGTNFLQESIHFLICLFQFGRKRCIIEAAHMPFDFKPLLFRKEVIIMILLNEKKEHDALVKFVWQEQVESLNLPQAAKKSFDGKYLSVFHIFGGDGKATLYAGLGEKKNCKASKIKSAVAKAVKTMRNMKMTEYAVDIAPLVAEYGDAAFYEAVCGIKLGDYKFAGVHQENEPRELTVTLIGVNESDQAKNEELVKKAEVIADSVILARDWVNMPGNLLTPAIMAEKAQELGTAAGCEVTVLDEAQCESLGMNTFLSVGKSSGNPAKLIAIRYMGDPSSKEITALVGKGVTLDTGGYCLKTAGGLTGTKGDMGGAAAVTGAILALAKNKVKANAIAVIPACENRLSRESTVPGDVVHSMNGKTVEILNTDAEGRLILADAVTYAIRVEKATRIVDVATLTGAVVQALGFSTAGLLTNDQAFADEFFHAAEIAGEQYWQFPAFDEYKDMLKSSVADIKNTGEGTSGTIVAGLFIGSFAEDHPWVHLDIAGTSQMDKPPFEYQVKGATGAAVTSMYFLVEQQGKAAK